MILAKLLIVSCCCILSLSHFAQSKEEHGTLTRDAIQSSVFKIKRLNAKDKVSQQRTEAELKPLRQLANVTTVAEKPSRKKKLKASTKNSHVLNKQLLTKMGFSKVKAPNSHNRKRLAIQSRRHASPDDSHMFIIKLPPNFSYYVNPKANGGGGEPSPKNALQAETMPANGKKVSFPFSSNGKPGRIYHWNLPIIKQILEDKQRFPNVATATKEQMIDIKNIPTWTRPWENEAIEKSYGKSHMMNYKKSIKRKSPTYYAPANVVSKSSFNKYFSGNGKPKGFYVMKENEKKPLYYKNIIT